MADPPQLIDLLPAVYRVRDAAQGGPLTALLGVIQTEVDRLRDDMAGLYSNWFIETCDEWVVPYIGQLLGVQGISPTGNAGFSQRGFVANTIGYRRSKGTAAVLERLGQDITGWSAHAVEFFELLQGTQYLNHVRPTGQATASLHDANALELVNSPFDTFAHSAEVRHIDNGRGRYDIANVAVFLWRIGAYPLARSTASPVTGQAGMYRFSPIGLDQPLFNYQRTAPDPDARTGPQDVPAPLSRLAVYTELQELDTPGAVPPASGYFDAAVPVLTVWINGSAVPVSALSICDLTDDTRRAPSGATVAIDPELGRLALAPGAATPATLEVSWAYGFPADIGGGPYDRQAALDQWVGEDSAIGFQKGVSRDAADDTANLFLSLSDAVAAWNAESPAPALGVITVMDNRTYTGDLAITVPAGSTLVLTAADWPTVTDPLSQLQSRQPGNLAASQLRPLLVGDIAVTGSAATDDQPPAQLIIDGLLIEGSVTVAPGALGRLSISNCTIVPTAGGITVQPGTGEADGNIALEVDVAQSITGPIETPALIELLSIQDSIVDGNGGVALTGPPTTISTTTVFGTATPETLTASDVIFAGAVTVTRRQQGCVRYSYVAPGSTVPRGYHCVPSNGNGDSVVPEFTSSSYGDAAYGQLASTCPAEISAGADDGGEMGAYNLLHGAYRLASLSAAINDYLRFGLEAGILFAT
jgi:hypothetical protein